MFLKSAQMTVILIFFVANSAMANSGSGSQPEKAFKQSKTMEKYARQFQISLKFSHDWPWRAAIQGRI